MKNRTIKMLKANENIAKKKVGREWKECRKIVCTGCEEQPSSEELFVTREDGVCSHMRLNNPCAFRAWRLLEMS